MFLFELIQFQVLTGDLLLINTSNVEEPKQKTVQTALNNMVMYNGRPKVKELGLV